MSAILPDVIGDILGSAARTALVRLYLPNFIEQGLGANEILRTFQSVGLGIRRKTFLGLVRQAKHVVIARQYVKAVGRDKMLDINRLEQQAFSGPELLHYQVRIIGHNKVTDAPFDTVRTLRSNTLLTREGAASAMLDFISEHENDYDWEIDGASTIGLVRNSNVVVDKVVGSTITSHLV